MRALLQHLWTTHKNVATDGPVRLTELTVLAADRLLLARVDLAGTSWRMTTQGDFANAETIQTRVLVTGIVANCFISGKPIWVDSVFSTRYIARGDIIIFLPGKLVFNMNLIDAQRRLPPIAPTSINGNVKP